MGRVAIQDLISLTDPGHRPVEVVQSQRLTAVDLIVVHPLLSGSVTAGGKQAVQDGQEDGRLEIESEAASLQQALDDPLAARAGGRWVLWADAGELDRLRRLRAHPRS